MFFWWICCWSLPLIKLHQHSQSAWLLNELEKHKDYRDLIVFEAKEGQLKFILYH